MSTPEIIIATIIAAGIFLFGLWIISLGFRFISFVRNYEPPPPKEMWTMVCNDAGRHSFISYDRKVYRKDYATRDEAEAEMRSTRAWHLDYEDRKSRGLLAAEEEREKARAASFKPCIPATDSGS